MNGFLDRHHARGALPRHDPRGRGRNGAWADHDVVGPLVPIVPDGGAPIAHTYIGIDDPGCSDTTRDCAFYDGSFTVAGEGEHAVTWFSVDATGAAEVAHHETIRIDKTAPVTAASVETAGDGTKVTLTATDARSGVVETDYDLDGAGFKPYGEPVLVTGAGDHTLRFRSVDHAGNFETPQTVSVRVAAPQPPAFTSKATAGPSRIELADGRLVAIKVAIDASAKPSRVRLLEVRRMNAKGAAVDGWTAGHGRPHRLGARGRRGALLVPLRGHGRVGAPRDQLDGRRRRPLTRRIPIWPAAHLRGRRRSSGGVHPLNAGGSGWAMVGGPGRPDTASCTPNRPCTEARQITQELGCAVETPLSCSRWPTRWPSPDPHSRPATRPLRPRRR